MSVLPLPALLLLEEVRLGWLDDPVSDVYLRTCVMSEEREKEGLCKMQIQKIIKISKQV